MKVITLKGLYHRNKECIGIYFKQDIILNDIVKRIVKAKWSKTAICWYLPCTKEYYELIVKTCGGEAHLQTAQLKYYL